MIFIFFFFFFLPYGKTYVFVRTYFANVLEVEVQLVALPNTLGLRLGVVGDNI